jgi:Arc/MetJ-type ribon-helix-helix transcriptional regulator
MATKKTVVSATRTAAKIAAAAGKAAAKPAVKPLAALPVKAAPVAKKPRKEAKQKVVRDSFTMPQSEYQKIAEIKEICLKAGMHVKKSEVLRAGLQALAGMNVAQLKRVLAGLEKIKTGRPKKH